MKKISDKERLDWITETGADFLHQSGGLYEVWLPRKRNPSSVGEDLRQAIDAAILSSHKGETQ